MPPSYARMLPHSDPAARFQVFGRWGRRQRDDPSRRGRTTTRRRPEVRAPATRPACTMRLDRGCRQCIVKLLPTHARFADTPCCGGRTATPRHYRARRHRACRLHPRRCHPRRRQPRRRHTCAAPSQQSAASQLACKQSAPSGPANRPRATDQHAVRASVLARAFIRASVRPSVQRPSVSRLPRCCVSYFQHMRARRSITERSHASARNRGVHIHGVYCPRSRRHTRHRASRRYNKIY